jgi:AcrR family transcriptional regulator
MTPAAKDAAAPKRRRDFEQNRAVILEAADAAFTEFGVGASINRIASRAGVGSATVYRHFPNREALVSAVFELRVLAYADAIEKAQSIGDPRAAFRATIHAMVDLQARDRSFREIIGMLDAIPFEHKGFERLGIALLGALTDAKESGVVRADVTNEDIMLFLLATESIAIPASAHSAAALDRLVDLALDGFCGESTAIAGESLTWDQLFDVTGN